MRIFVSAGSTDEPVFYKQIPNDKDINVTCTCEEAADSFVDFITKLSNAASRNPEITGIEYIVPKE